MEVIDKLYPITYNKVHYTVVANDIIKGKQDMSLLEARLVRLLITQVVKEDKDLKTYVVKATDLAKFLGLPKNDVYRDIKEITDTLQTRIIKIGTGNPRKPWKTINWMQLAEHDGNGGIILMLSDQLKPYVLELNKWFTQYKLQEVLYLNSFYAIRMYELLKCLDGEKPFKEYIELSISELRTFFSCEVLYDRISDFKRYVIELSLREINNKTDIYVDVEYIKTGRAITSARFYLRTNFKNIKERQNERAADR